MRTHLAVLLAAFAATTAACGGGAPTAVAPSPAPRLIEPQHAIAGVRIGMTERAVRAKLGRPDAVLRTDLHAGYRKWRFDGRVPVVVSLDTFGKVWDVRTRSRSHRSAAGWGVGSTERELRDAIPALRCRAYGGGPRVRGWRSCVDDPTYRGAFTVFVVRGGRVVEVTVSRGLVR